MVGRGIAGLALALFLPVWAQQEVTPRTGWDDARVVLAIIQEICRGEVRRAPNEKEVLGCTFRHLERYLTTNKLDFGVKEVESDEDGILQAPDD